MKTRILTSSLVLIEVRPGMGEPYSADRTGKLPNRKDGTVLKWEIMSP